MPGSGGSIQLGRIFGIRIGVTPSWFFVLFVLIFLLSGSFRDVLGGSSSQAYFVAVGSALLFYVSLVLHELGHALVARRQGIEVERIDLWIFGGLAQLSSQPRSPGREFAVAVAGPLVTAVVAVVCAIAATLVDGSSHFLDAARLHTGTHASAGFVLLSFVASMNVILLAFNIVPAFPLDGGRMLMALAWRITGDRARGLRIAGFGGLGFGYLLIGVGIFFLLHGDAGDGIWFGFLGWMLAGSARSAVNSGRVQQRLHAVTVADVMDPHPFTLPGSMTVLEAQERVFEPHGWPFVAVVDDEGRFLGVLRRDTVDADLGAGRPALTVAEVIGAPAGHGDGFSIQADQPLEALLSTRGLAALGAVFAVDDDGMLRGVVTLEQLQRAVSPASGR